MSVVDPLPRVRRCVRFGLPGPNRRSFDRFGMLLRTPLRKEAVQV